MSESGGGEPAFRVEARRDGIKAQCEYHQHEDDDRMTDGVDDAKTENRRNEKAQ